MTPFRRRFRRLLLAGLSALGAAVIAAVGTMLFNASTSIDGHETSLSNLSMRLRWLGSSAGQELARLSYDFPFIVRGNLEPPPCCIVYLDERSASVLGQRGGLWDRRVHTELVRRLTKDGARMVFFDIVFADPATEAGVDEDFAAAIKENGKVFLGAALELDSGLNASQERTVPPTPLLRRSAVSWGLLAFRPLDADYGVRRIYSGLEMVPSATWRAARWLGSDLAEMPEKEQTRWMNYYGPSGTFPSVSYDRALAADGVPPDFFRDRIVFIGGRSTLDVLMLGKDDFRNPYGLIGAEFSKGVEVHLTAMLNLLRKEWLTRVDPRWESALVIVIGLLLGGGLPWLRPHLAALVTGIVIVATGCIAYWLFAHQHLWLAWMIPAVVQAPLALAWAVGSRYFVEERRRQMLRQAFAHYLSPQMADRIADLDFDLRPGGIVTEATVMFTDLENFTTLAEQLDNPARVAQVLTTYFTQTTSHILENDGTIIKYAGDAVQAAWGAPLEDEDHARKAVLAAWHLHEASKVKVEEHSMRTRIGVHTGRVLAGNLGSAQRFDFAVIGDTVNFASRLEGLNKYLGTDILISEDLHRLVEGHFQTRCLGEFRVAGKKATRVIYEVFGLRSDEPPAAWIALFQQGMEAFRAGDLTRAGQLMRETIEARGGDDGPAGFYLRRIEERKKRPLPEDWHGVVELTDK